MSNAGGRSTYQNVASTRPTGLEVEWKNGLDYDLDVLASYRTEFYPTYDYKDVGMAEHEKASQ